MYWTDPKAGFMRATKKADDRLLAALDVAHMQSLTSAQLDAAIAVAYARHRAAYQAAGETAAYSIRREYHMTAD